MRLIDADALIEQMEADAEHMEESLFEMAAYAAINDVKHQPTIEPQKWIPRSERLPEKKQTVIVSVNDGRAEYTEVDEWTGTGFWAYGPLATAWMPLPEPYKEGEK